VRFGFSGSIAFGVPGIMMTVAKGTAMNATPDRSAEASTELSRSVASLANRMQVPVNKIEEIYSNELSRLTAEARLQMFVGVLAISRTRDILRQNQRRRAHG
jgi:Protein of unknown function (DUF3562)